MRLFSRIGNFIKRKLDDFIDWIRYLDGFDITMIFLVVIVALLVLILFGVLIHSIASL